MLYEYGVPRLANPTSIPGELLVLRTTAGTLPVVAGVNWSTLNPVLNQGGDLVALGVLADLPNQGYQGLSFTVEILPEH